MDIETERMVLRRCTPADVDDLVALHTDPAVMRYLGPCDETAEHVRDAVLPSWHSLDELGDGFGYRVAIERDGGAFLGWFLFRAPRKDPRPGVIEVGYRLHRAAWGRGLATEGARRLVDKGFAELPIDTVVADTMTINTGSRRVMEKLGMRYVGTVHPHYDDPVPGTEHGDVLYEITRAEWAAARRAP
ncbi:GNAT family N-acetyltransferase [Pseudonocardia abyssalis]|uniref:GNAT family N-acetyltransferase n=1 Tax=Pseudonocardia abyssalis TaxID=2792008 RepID=UPI003558D101